MSVNHEQVRCGKEQPGRCHAVFKRATHATRATKGKVTDRKLKVESLSSFGEDARGRVYAASLNGPVYRLVQR